MSIMKSKWYRSTGIKTLLIIICTVSVVVGALCMAAATTFYSEGIRPGDSKEYLKSNEFTTEFYDEYSSLLDAIANSQILDWDEDTISIDMDHKVEATTLQVGADTGLTYKWDDLYQWAQKNIEYNDRVLICTQPNGKEYYVYLSDFKDKIKSGEWELILDSHAGEKWTTQDVLDELENSYYLDVSGVSGVTDSKGKELYTGIAIYDGDCPDELYSPVGADSILDIVNENENWQGRIDDAFKALQEILTRIYDGIQGEQNLTTGTYAKGNTNLQYVYWDKEQDKFYTNTNLSADAKFASKLTSAIKDSDPYVILKPTMSECSTNLRENNYSLQSWKQALEATMFATTGKSSGDYVMAVWVDSDLSISEDALATQMMNYETGNKWMIPAIVGVGVSALLFFITIIWLTIAAGRRTKDEDVHLNWFDHIYTEIAAAIVLIFWGLWGIFLEIFEEIYQPHNVTMATLGFVVAVIAFWTIVWFLIGWLSLVRRIKAHTLWKNCLIYKVIHVCTKAVRGIWNKLLHKNKKHKEILKGLEEISGGNLPYKIPTENLKGDELKMAEMINNIGDGLDAAVERSMKNERMKTELITNVSHDIKTPLTSIINYVDLLKRENFTDPKIIGYLDILDEKAKRLKTLTEDVLEASKVSTGNIVMEMSDLNFVEMIHQVIGEYEERFAQKNLQLVPKFGLEEAMISADGRRLWRVLDNLFANVCKYSMENTRVYADVEKEETQVAFSLKNISAQPLNISADELTERFIRGDVARSTEGSGLGLSIAKDLTELQGGTFEIYLDGDLFRVTIKFDLE